MNHTLTAPVAERMPTSNTDDTVTSAVTNTGIRPGLLGGLGGLVFAASVLVQNAIRAGFPTNDASTEEVVRYYADHRGATIALAMMFPLGVVALVTFLGTVISRVHRGAGRVAALAGALGGAGIIATFSIVTATDIAIAAYIHRGSADPSVVEGLWVLHNSVFGLVMASLGAALGGLAIAASRAGLLSKRWGVAGPIGAILLLAGAATTPAMVDGSATMFIGVAGFVVWLAFVIRTGVALLRSGEV